MADDNPTGGKRVGQIDLPAKFHPIVRCRLTTWIWGIRDDLRTPERMRRPELALREVEAYERVLLGITVGRMLYPDGDAKAFVQNAAYMDDEASGYLELRAHHEALHGLIAALDRGIKDPSGDGEGERP